MVKRHRQSGSVHTHTMNVSLSYRRIPRTEVAYTSCLAGSSGTFAGRIPVPSSDIPFAHPSADKKPYYNGGLSLNKSIDLTSISL